MSQLWQLLGQDFFLIFLLAASSSPWGGLELPSSSSILLLSFSFFCRRSSWERAPGPAKASPLPLLPVLGPASSSSLLPLLPASLMLGPTQVAPVTSVGLPEPVLAPPFLLAAFPFALFKLSFLPFRPMSAQVGAMAQVRKIGNEMSSLGTSTVAVGLFFVYYSSF